MSKRKFLVIDIQQGRYKCIGTDLVPFYRHTEPPADWFNATVQAIAKGNDISLTEAFYTDRGAL